MIYLLSVQGLGYPTKELYLLSLFVIAIDT